MSCHIRGEVLNLWELMEKLHVRGIMEMLTRYGELASLIAAFDETDLEKPYSAGDLVKNLLESYGKGATASGLKVTAGLVDGLLARIRMAPTKAEYISQQLLAIQDAFHLELDNHCFLYLNKDTSAYLFKENAFGDEVSKAFPSIAYDLSEACTCYALDRSTACVYHLMRVLEVPIRCIRNALGMTGNYPAWGSFLNEMAKANNAKNSDKKSAEYLFFADLEGQLWAIKNAWRDEAMHSVASKYTEREAQAIFRAVEGFMQKAATKLKE